MVLVTESLRSTLRLDSSKDRCFCLLQSAREALPSCSSSPWFLRRTTRHNRSRPHWWCWCSGCQRWLQQPTHQSPPLYRQNGKQKIAILLQGIKKEQIQIINRVLYYRSRSAPQGVFGYVMGQLWRLQRSEKKWNLEAFSTGSISRSGRTGNFW